MTLIVFSIQGCHPGVVLPSSVSVFQEKSLRSYDKSSRIAIVPFETDVMKPELGIVAGKIFEEEISKRKIFPCIMIEQTPWDKQLTVREQKIQAAFFEARQRGADMLLWGDIERFELGIVSEAKVVMSVMLFDIHENSLLWWGKGTTKGIPGNTFLLLNHHASDETPPLNKLIESIARNIVNTMFDDMQKPWFEKLMQHIRWGKGMRQPQQVSTRDLQQQESAVIPHRNFEEGEGRVMKHEHDIIDQVFNELENAVAE